MAALIRGSTSSEHSVKPTAISSKRRHHHGRPESRSRRPHSEHSHTSSHHHIRSSPPRQHQTHNQRYPSPVSMKGNSLSASAPSLTIAHDMVGITMERTPSGNSIMSDTPISYSSPLDTNTLLRADSEAARRVEIHFSSSRRRSPSRTRSHRKHHERILRKLIRRDDPLDNSLLDDHALAGILTTADTLFFDGVLSTRVQWEWSSQEQYHNELIGTTALRRCTDRDGFETLIILSEPILKDPSYDRRLLLSAFLHELIHCYLFITCGFEARMQGGHTEGFHRIAAVIDHWVGEGYLSLCSMKANLDHFRRVEREDEGGTREDEWGMRTHRQQLDDSHHHHRQQYQHVHEHEEWCNQSPRSDGMIDLGPPSTTFGYL